MQPEVFCLQVFLVCQDLAKLKLNLSYIVCKLYDWNSTPTWHSALQSTTQETEFSLFVGFCKMPSLAWRSLYVSYVVCTAQNCLTTLSSDLTLVHILTEAPAHSWCLFLYHWHSLIIYHIISSGPNFIVLLFYLHVYSIKHIFVPTVGGKFAKV